MLKSFKFIIDGFIQGLVIYFVIYFILSNNNLLIYIRPVLIILVTISLVFSVIYGFIINKEPKLIRNIINSVISLIACMLCLVIITILSISFDLPIMTIKNELNNAHGILIIIVLGLYLLITTFFRTIAILIVFFRQRDK